MSPLILPIQCFESIQKYGADLLQLFEDLESGKFIQQNFDNLLRQEEGKQLLSEVCRGCHLHVNQFHFARPCTCWV